MPICAPVESRSSRLRVLFDSIFPAAERRRNTLKAVAMPGVLRTPRHQSDFA